MRLKIIRAFRITFAHLVHLMDTILSFFLKIVGRAERPYLNDWEASLGPRRAPKYPPQQEPSAPRYRYSRMDFNTRVRAAVVVHYVDRSVLEPLLPDLLQLDQAPDAPPGKHPVMFSFGLNSRFSAVITPWRFRTITYLEFLTSIPNARLKNCHEGYSGPFVYPPRLWAGNLLPVMVGKALAFPKKFALIESTPDSFTIRTFWERRTIASIKITPCGNPSPAPSIPGVGPWSNRVNQPIMTETGSSEPLFCHFQFEWNLAAGQPAEITLTVEDEAFPVLAPGTYKFPAIREGHAGGLMIASPCQLQIPFPRSSLRKLNPGPCDESGSDQGATANREADTERAPDRVG